MISSAGVQFVVGLWQMDSSETVAACRAVTHAVDEVHDYSQALPTAVAATAAAAPAVALAAVPAAAFAAAPAAALVAAPASVLVAAAAAVAETEIPSAADHRASNHPATPRLQSLHAQNLRHQTSRMHLQAQTHRC